MLPSHYAHLETLRETARSRIDLCVDRRDGDRVLVKSDPTSFFLGEVPMAVLQPRLWSSRAARSLREQEARALALLGGEGAPRLREHLMHEGRELVCMEWVEGTPLLAWYSGQAEPEVAIAIVGDGIATTLLRASNAALVHRDIKPSNVLIATDDKAILLDWELASVAGRQALGTVGTRGYIAPELLGVDLGEVRDVDGRIDLYSLGGILFRLATGISPAEVPGLGLIVAAGPYLRAAQISASQRELILGLLERLPSNRPTPNDVISVMRGGAVWTRSTSSCEAKVASPLMSSVERLEAMGGEFTAATAVAWAELWLAAGTPENALLLASAALNDGECGPLARLIRASALASIGDTDAGDEAVAELTELSRTHPNWNKPRRALLEVLLARRGSALESVACALELSRFEQSSATWRRVAHAMSWRVVLGGADSADLVALGVAAIELAFDGEPRVDDPLVRVALNAFASLLDRGETPGPLASAAWIVALHLAGQDSSVVSLARHVLRAGGFVRARGAFPLESSDLATATTPVLLALVDLGLADRALDMALGALHAGPAPTINAWLDIARLSIIIGIPLECDLALPPFVRLSDAARRILRVTDSLG
jgi:serine/threonine protein kinase